VVAIRLLGPQTALVVQQNAMLKVFSLVNLSAPVELLAISAGENLEALPHSLDLADNGLGVLVLNNGTTALLHITCNDPSQAQL
jgi:hypothetical protein